MDLKKWLDKLKEKEDQKNSNEKKNVGNLLIVLLVGVLIVVTISFFKSSSLSEVQTLSNQNKTENKDESAPQKDFKDYEASVQQKLKDTLEKVEGVGKVEVMISFESGEEHVPAVNINDSTNTAQEKDNEGGTRNTTQKNNGSTVVITNDGNRSQPLIVKTYKPKVSGVCVVAEGAENRVTELRIAKAVVDLFSIPKDKVNVYPMKK